MLDLKGNTAIYLMYSYARICSIASKAGVQKSQLASVLPSVHEAKERALCLHLLKVCVCVCVCMYIRTYMLRPN